MQLHLVQPVPAPELSWGTGCSSTQQTGGQGAQGCWLALPELCRYDAGRHEDRWVLGPGSGAGTSSSLCPALGLDSGASESGPRDFKVLYLGRASSMPLTQWWRRERRELDERSPLKLDGRAHLGVGSFLLERVGLVGPQRVLQGGLGAQAAPADL